MDEKERLEKVYGDEATYGETPSGENEGSLLGNGRPWAICTSWALHVEESLPGRVKVYGFFDSENPTSEIAQLAGGHDFAVVDDRYIVDGWVKNVEAISKKAVFDLHDPADAEETARLYGDRNLWTSMEPERPALRH
jgi:hypothetical protein